MDKIRKTQYLLFLFLAIGFVACDDDEKYSAGTGHEGVLMQLAEEVDATAQQLWSSSPLVVDAERTTVLTRIQGYADKCRDDYFKSYLNGYDWTSASMEKCDPILYFYRSAFDRVMDGVRNSKVENGTVEIWLLYNMGYVVKTPSGCFAVDISHRWAKELAPYIDFLCVTHNHSDHYNKDLIQAMFDLGKPVLSNYLKDETYPYTTATGDKDYEIGKFKIKTCITDHNNSGLSDYVTVFSIDCGDDTGNFVFMHVGDSSYRPEQYTNLASHVNVLIPRYGPNPLIENNILGTGAGQVEPDYALLSHILELAHAEGDSRWTLDMALERASKINCKQTYVPMWGEKMVWKNNKLN